MVLSLVTLFSGLLISFQPNGFGTTKVAVVNLPAVSSSYQRTADLEAAFEKQRVKFTQERDTLSERIERMSRSLEQELKPGSDAHSARVKEIIMLEAERKWMVESEGRRMEHELQQSLRSIFDDIHTMIREVAEEWEIDIVVAADRLPENEADNPSQLRQKILLQKVLYWNPRMDISDEVITRLNRRYEQSRSGSSEKTAPKPLN